MTKNLLAFYLVVGGQQCQFPTPRMAIVTQCSSGVLLGHITRFQTASTCGRLELHLFVWSTRNILHEQLSP